MNILHVVNQHIFEEFQNYAEHEYSNEKIRNETQASIESHSEHSEILVAWKAYKQGWLAGNSKPPEAHGESCYYCSVVCNALAGNPSFWPIPLAHSDEPGKVKWHHMGCVSSRLEQLANLQKEG
jgi:hypothetical protein